jgi:hypothetical protein
MTGSVIQGDGQTTQATFDRTAAGPRKSNYKLLRICCWSIALAMGAAQAWLTRFTMNPDGVSYLDIGDAYWRGDWHNAINAYWSPLYSWLLGFFLKVLKPSSYWEYPLVHLVNFLMYATALACFDFFLSSFVAHQKERDLELASQGEMGIPDWGWWLLGYSLFLFSTLVLVGLHLVTPDLCVAGCVYLSVALVLKIRSGAATRKAYIALGMVLGIGYLAKAAMFPLGIVFVLTAFVAGRRTRRSAQHAALTMVVFLAVGSPFIAALCHKQRSLTFSNVGRVAYEVYVDGIDQFIPESPSLTHPVRRIFDRPPTYKFDQPIRGTYPLWYDPDYWHAGVNPFFRLSGQRQAIQTALLLSLLLVGSVSFQLVVTTGLLILFLMAPRPSRCFRRAADSWYLAAPVIFAFLMYALVYFEYRYVAPFVCLGWIFLFSGTRLPMSKGLKILVRCIVLIVAIEQAASTVGAIRKPITGPYVRIPVYWHAASALQEVGLRGGNEIALISNQPWGEGGPFVARLLRLRAVAQVNRPSEFWGTSLATQGRVLVALKETGAKAALSWGDHPPSKGWRRLGETSYFVYMFPSDPH